MDWTTMAEVRRVPARVSVSRELMLPELDPLAGLHRRLLAAIDLRPILDPLAELAARQRAELAPLVRRMLEG